MKRKKNRQMDRQTDDDVKMYVHTDRQAEFLWKDGETQRRRDRQKHGQKDNEER